MLANRESKVLVNISLSNGLDLSGLDLQRADFHRAVVDGLSMAGADLREADFSDSDLYWLDLYMADCIGACFRDGRFEGASFKNACLEPADFTGAVIERDRLGNPSTFAHADLSEANFEGAHLSGVEYDDRTVFPSGFEPTSHGMVLINGKIGDRYYLFD